MDPSIPQLVKLCVANFKSAANPKHGEQEFVEIEARLRGEIVNHISVTRLFNYPCDWTKTKYLEKKRISKIDRKCTYRNRKVYSPENSLPYEESITICKSSLAKDELYNLWCTVHVSTEINAPTMLDSLEDVEEKDITRIRSTMHGHWIDVTYDSSDSTYNDARVEIEVPDSSTFDPQGLMYAISYVCSILQDSVPVMVEKLDWTTISYLVKQPFGAFCVSTKSYQKPITMVKDDVMKVLSENSQAKRTSVKWLATPKADGVRRMVYIMEGIVLSVDMAGSVRHVCTSLSLANDYEDISILDCEYLADTYYVIDIPVHNAKYIGNMPTSNRLQIAKDTLSSFYFEMAKIVMKPYKSFSSFLELEKLYFFWLKEYNIDGIIFANQDEGYFQRVLKWKDVNTVDLQVAKSTDGIVLKTCDGYTLDIRRITVTNEDALTFGIWEFKHIINQSSAVLEPVRHRPDKPRANSLSIVNKNTRSYDLPTGLFTGVECFLMRKYHNKEKALLLLNSHIDNAVIMDIGTGQGGDLKKWRTAKEVYCLEPDKHALEELRNRINSLRKNKPKFKVNIIECLLSKFRFHDIAPKISIFTAFFCMNLWKEEDWNMLEQTINIKGSKRCKFIAIAITHPVQENNKSWTLKLTSDTTYTLSIHNTRITNINESVVKINKLNDIMKRCGLQIVLQKRLNNRKAMTRPENTLSNMYTAFVYIRRQNLQSSTPSKILAI